MTRRSGGILGRSHMMPKMRIFSDGDGECDTYKEKLYEPVRKESLWNYCIEGQIYEILRRRDKGRRKESEIVELTWEMKA